MYTYYKIATQATHDIQMRKHYYGREREQSDALSPEGKVTGSVHIRELANLTEAARNMQTGMDESI